MSNVVTARISDEALAHVDRLAVSRDRSRAWILAKLIESAAKKQVEMDDFIQVGLDDIEAGRTIPHEEVVARIMERRTRRAAA
jgi:predicted transcriptional regulator